MEPLYFAKARYWTPFEWLAALWEGDHRRRSLYLSRDYRWATRQARVSDFELAWSQRIREAKCGTAVAA